MQSPKVAARVAGVAYLVCVVTGLFAEVAVRGSVIVSGDAAATARNILASEGLYRLGFAADLVGSVAYLVVTLLLYQLLKPVSAGLSLLAAFFSIVGIAIGGAASLGHLAPLLILKPLPYLSVFDPAQLQSLAYLALKLHAQGYLVALVFFGCYEVVLGYLIFKSTFFPRTLGVLVCIAGVAFLTNSFAIFVAPQIGDALNNLMLALDGVGEISLTLWLLVIGLDAERWLAKAYPAKAS
ncbi:MAG: DUF4386 domain-containing protein [Candidatus Eremiobacteraeota bacterium]|nr:DUF4386 domain-containing protein [Candidatus Eremiobacteraeota bacterium]